VLKFILNALEGYSTTFLNIVLALRVDTAVLSLDVCKKMPSGAIFLLKIHKNALAALALPRTPLGIPRSSSWFSLAVLWQVMGGEERGEKGNGREHSPLLFLQFNHFMACLALVEVVLY